MALSPNTIWRMTRSRNALGRLERIVRDLKAQIPQEVFYAEIRELGQALDEVRRQERQFRRMAGRNAGRGLWWPNRRFYGSVKREAENDVKEILKG